MTVRQWRVQRPLVLALGLLALVSAPSPAADKAAEERAKASEARLKKDITFLASDECEGRGPTTQGINKAADHIAAEFKKAGLKPGNSDGSYFQPFPLPMAAKVLDEPAKLVLKGPLGQEIALKQGLQFNPLALGASGKLTGAGVVFAGYGITSTSKEVPYNDYDGLDVAGKVVVVLGDAPRAGNRDLPVTFRVQANVFNKLTTAAKNNAAAVLYVSDADTAKTGDDLYDFGYYALGRRRGGAGAEVPVFHVRRSVLQAMLQGSAAVNLSDLEHDIDRDLKPRSLDLKGWTVSLDLKMHDDKIQVKNVIGVLEGSGPLAKETIVIGAHYDHLGYGGAGGSMAFGAKKMAIHHGADDNGSGTTSVIELARRFGAIKNREGRRLVFMTYSGEELGLIGSRYYCDHPIFPLADTAAMVNLDMVGRGKMDPDKKTVMVDVYGCDTSKEFSDLLDAANKKHDVAIKKLSRRTGRYFGASDQYSFYAKKVPVFFFFTGVHPDYHRPSDTSEKINVIGMRQIVDLSEDLVASLATGKRHPFELIGTEPPPDTTRPLPLGIRPTNDGKEGILIGTVVKDGPADKAGLKAGDRIVEVAGKPVKNLAGFVQEMSNQKRGDKIDVGVMRGDKKEVIKVEVPATPGRRTSLGTRPDLNDTKEGVLIEAVREGTPAAKAGIKAGDRLVALAGKPLKDVEAYAEVLRTLTPGTPVEVTFLRDGKKQTVTVTPE
jgi:hypothetical protein